MSETNTDLTPCSAAIAKARRERLVNQPRTKKVNQMSETNTDLTPCSAAIAKARRERLVNQPRTKELNHERGNETIGYSDLFAIFIMNTKNQFEAQRKALEFQEMYYPSDCLLKQRAQSEAIRVAFAQGFEMAQRLMQERLDEPPTENAQEHPPR
jgi:hypothetical protein